MEIYLTHKIHGTKIAIAEEEAKQDEKNGWVRYPMLEVEKPKRAGRPPKVEPSIATFTNMSVEDEE